MRRRVLVTGGNRGIGLEVARQLAAQGLHIIVGARDADSSQNAIQALRAAGATADSVAIDVSNADSVSGALREIEDRFGPVDVLVNNAAVLLDTPGGFKAKLSDLTDDIMRATFETNVIAPARLIRALVPGMQSRHYGRIVNVSSVAGQLAEMQAGYPAYRMSKTALNALTRTVAAELVGSNVKINSVCPGWCRTDMGGAAASRTAAQGADSISWLATLPDNGPSGQFFQDRSEIAW